jgi:hypothetical protein
MKQQMRRPAHSPRRSSRHSSRAPGSCSTAILSHIGSAQFTAETLQELPRLLKAIEDQRYICGLNYLDECKEALAHHPSTFDLDDLPF